jgi:hypothetical protein
MEQFVAVCVCVTKELLLNLETSVRVSDCCYTKQKVATTDLLCLEYLFDCHVK